MSRPRLSVPSTKRIEPPSAHAGAARTASRNCSLGGYGAITSAKIANSTTITTTASPTTALRFSLKASQARAGDGGMGPTGQALARARPPAGTRLSMTNARVDQPVGQIDHQVDEDHGGRDQHHATLQRRIVTAPDRFDQPLAHTRPREDRFGQHGTRHQRAHLQPDDRDHRDQRIAQRVQADHASRWQTFGARGAHVVLAEHLEHRRARHARDHRQRNGAEHDCRQHEVVQRVLQRTGLARQPGIDGHETGDRLEVVLDQVDAPRHRRQTPTLADEHDQQQAPPEDRHRIAGDRESHQRLVVQAAATRGCDGAGGQPDQHREQHRGERQLDRGREQRSELGEHLLIGGQRHAEVAVQQLPHVVEELLPHRLVEPQFMPKLRQALRRDAALAYTHFDRITRHQADRHEGDEHQRDERRDRQRQAAQQESKHRGLISSGRRRPAFAGPQGT